MSTPPPEYATNDDLRAAHKMNKLVDEGIVSPREAKKMSEEEFDRALNDLFDTKFEQHYRHPERMREKTHGQRAEALAVQFLNELGLGFHAELAADAFDHGRQKADVVLHLEGYAKPIFLQITIRRDEGVAEKFAKLPPETIGIQLPLSVFGAEQTHDVAAIRRLAQDVLRQVIAGLRTSPAHVGAFAALTHHFLGSKAA